MGDNSTRAPIIIIGMHRSGTSMIARMLEELGLFVGKKKEENHEAVFFLQINDWLLCQSGGSWDNPEPIYHLLGNKEVRMLAIDYIQYLMKTPHVVSYLGWSKYLRCCTPVNLDIPWGWKDPRNAYTLPLWLDIFPEAKVIHIYRNGVDVANSLKVRAEKSLAKSKVFYPKRKWMYWIRPKRTGFVDTLRCIDLNGGFLLWADYLQKAQTHVKSLDARAMDLKYEDFVAEPFRALKQLTCFCGLKATDEEIRRVAGQVKKGRAYAYQGKSELEAFAKQVFERLRLFGY